jgi:REP element-mobilizing transposase RayT
MSYTNLLIHFVWSTKNREPLIRAEFQSELYAYIGGIIRKRDHALLAAGGMADHIHLLVAMHQQQAIADLVRDVKSNSTLWIKDNQSGLNGFSWQIKYAALSVSQSVKPDVEKYIGNQEEHHRTRSFKEEFAMLLQRHGIEFDEKFVWE